MKYWQDGLKNIMIKESNYFFTFLCENFLWSNSFGFFLSGHSGGVCVLIFIENKN